MNLDILFEMTAALGIECQAPYDPFDGDADNRGQYFDIHIKPGYWYRVYTGGYKGNFATSTVWHHDGETDRYDFDAGIAAEIISEWVEAASEREAINLVA